MKGTIHEVVKHFENTLPSFREELEEAARKIAK